jgi:carbon storage regulator CsrA
MLVIDRKVSEGFYVGSAFVKVLPGSTKGRVRIGIDAPKEIPIVREELVGNDPPPSDNHPVIPGPWPKAA